MKKRCTAEQIVTMLHDADAKVAGGSTVEQVCRELRISEATYYSWRKKSGRAKVYELNCMIHTDRFNWWGCFRTRFCRATSWDLSLWGYRHAY